MMSHLSSSIISSRASGTGRAGSTRCCNRHLGRAALLTLSVLLAGWQVPSRAMAQIAGKGPQLLQNNTFGKHPETGGTYTIVAGTDLGNWTSGLPYTPTNAIPTTTAVAIQLDVSGNQVPFPGDATNGIPASRTWLYMRGVTTAAATADFWKQNVSVRPSTVYTFACYASNATAVGSTGATTPQLEFYVGGTKVGATTTLAPETTAAGGDKWTRYTVSYTTTAAQTELSLSLRNPRSTTGTGNELAISSISFRADNPGAVNNRYSCDGSFYQIRQVVSTTTTPTNSTSLFDVNRSTGNAYTTLLKSNLGATLNGLGYRPGDGLQYALTYVSNGVNSAANATGADRINEFTDPIEVNVIDRSGDIRSAGLVTGLPGTQWAGGVIDRAGFYYVVSQDYNTAANPTRLYRIDLNDIERGVALTATQVALTGMPLTNLADGAAYYAMFDLAFNARDGNLYGTDYTGRVYKIVLGGTTAAPTAAVTLVGNSAVPITPTTAGTNALGTCFFDITGALYAYRNGGEFYIIDITTGVATSLSTIDPAANSDGASCVTPDQSIDVVKEVVGVTAVSSTVYTVDFSIKVRNNGSITNPNVQVSDVLWGGNATANTGTTFSGASNVVISGLTVTPIAGSLVAANTSYTGQTGQAGLLTGTQSLAPGQGGTIRFRAQVTFPSAGAVPAAGQNNTAFATSTVGSYIGYTLQSNALVPPPDLLAQDASTNSAALPATANADAGSPSPIYYKLAILGNVFEDSNYGGGAGRSQEVSNGLGVVGAQVELYDGITNVLVKATTTDEAGNYGFVNGVGGVTLAPSTTYQVRVVNSSVLSNRVGSVAGLLGVQTYLNGDANRVGGEAPNSADAVANTGSQTLLQVRAAATTASTALQSLTPLTGAGSVTTPSTALAAPVVGVDFGFNFDAVVNTNDAGQGSLRQFITNSNQLTNANLAQAGLPTGKEYALFMLNDGRATGTAPAGLRLGMAAPGGYSLVTKQFTITVATALPDVTDSNTAIDGLLQNPAHGQHEPALYCCWRPNYGAGSSAQLQSARWALRDRR